MLTEVNFHLQSSRQLTQQQLQTLVIHRTVLSREKLSKTAIKHYSTSQNHLKFKIRDFPSRSKPFATPDHPRSAQNKHKKLIMTSAKQSVERNNAKNK